MEAALNLSIVELIAPLLSLQIGCSSMDGSQSQRSKQTARKMTIQPSSEVDLF